MDKSDIRNRNISFVLFIFWLFSVNYEKRFWVKIFFRKFFDIVLKELICYRRSDEKELMTKHLHLLIYVNIYISSFYLLQFFSSYNVWKHVRYHVLISRHPGVKELMTKHLHLLIYVSIYISSFYLLLDIYISEKNCYSKI